MLLRIGDRGRTTSPLRPTGEVTIAGVRHVARSESGWVDAGVEVVVVAADAHGPIVRPAAEIEAGGDLPGRGSVISSIPERDERRERAIASGRQEQLHLDRRRTLRDLRDRVAAYAVLALLASGLGWWLAGAQGVFVSWGIVASLILFLEVAGDIGA